MDDKEVKVEKKPEEVKETETKEVQETRAFENFIRGRVVHERAGELTPAANSGQVLIPTTIANKIIKKVYNISPVLERSSKYNVKGNLKIPYYDTSTSNINVAYQEEFSPLASSNGKFTTISLGGFLAGALSKISRSLINNSQFDIVGFIVDEMAYSIKRFIEKELLNGTVDKVTGLSDLSNTLTAASTIAITADEVIQLKDKIIDEYQGNAIWIMSPATRTALRLLKDSVGRYLLQDDITSPFGSTLLGKPIYVSDNMPDMEAGKTAIYYGDMRGLATKFSEDLNIEVLREKYADEHAVGVIGWFEFDSKVEDAQKIVRLNMAAS
jgi:HK97 family phage major capsid protein